MRDVFSEIEQWLAAGKRIATATVVSVVGSAPRNVGATLAVNEDGEIAGSVSGGCVEPAVIEDELRALRGGSPKLLTFGITEEQNVEQIGLSCGGEIRVFVEPLHDDALLDALRRALPAATATVIAAPASRKDLLGARVALIEGASPLGTTGLDELDAAMASVASDLLAAGRPETRSLPLPGGETCEVYIGVYPAPPTLIIVGAGHVTLPLIRIAKVLGYHVIVIDPREAFATPDRLRDADETLLEWPDEAMAHLSLNSATAVAVLTHDDKFDVPALQAALGKPVS
ncbi:MAG: XdhC family protein, partial [Ktedonobacterales bacterium]